MSHNIYAYIQSVYKESDSFFIRKSTLYFNACIKSFHSLFKKEEVNLNFSVSSSSIFEISNQNLYNKKRMHNAIIN